ncbi:hypothetical protein VTN77DRAFT_7952 [Rasamsonia byssochlamydoides]|uniref:uncharacterized protein n=1 Tax=Rasamsonia byssochlamydoides TaxID=89139 RepID=UPI0037440553
MDEGWNNERRPSQIYHPSLPSPRSLEGGPASAPIPSEFKVPIPRLQRPTQLKASVSSERQRVSHACEPCRRRKSKCDGVQPICSRCRDHELLCFYADGKRERLKRSAKSLVAKVTLYESLLIDLLPSLEPARQQAVRNAIAENNPLHETDVAASGEGTASGEDGNDDDYPSVTSPEFQDGAQQDVPGFIGPSGFLGRSSVVRWMEEASVRMTVSSLGSNVSGLPLIHRQTLTTMNRANSLDEFHQLLMEGCDYFANHLDVSDFGVFGENVDAFQLPPRQTADALVNSYFSTVHPFFPVLSWHDFIAHYQSYFETRHPPGSSIHWIATLNLVFALGALYGSSCKAAFIGSDKDHVLYFLRSRILSQEPTQMFDLPTMDHVQYTTLSGIYLLASYQMNRAWSAVALAIRYAQACALHLVEPDVTDPQREYQARVWQCICSLEQFLCVWTGRPPAIQSRFTNGPFPKAAEPSVSQSLSQAATQYPMSRTPFPEGTKSFISTGWSTFTACLYLDRIVAEVLGELYSPGMINQAWASVQQLVSILNAKLDHWHLSLPPNLRLSAGQSDSSSHAQSQRSYLAFRFYSTRMLINWPCLCKTRNISLPMTLQSESSKSVDAEAVEQCREAARDLLRLLPDNGTVSAVYDSTPWWCVLHFVVQAGVILALEILPEAGHTRSSDTEQLIAECVKAIQWLRALSETSVPARRAWFAYSRLMQLALANAGKDPSMLAPYVPADTSLPSSFASEDTAFLGQHTGYLGL